VAGVRLVTGYVRLDGHRPHERYVELGNRLLSLPLPITLFTDAAGFSPGPSVEVRPAGRLWLQSMIGDASPIIPRTDNPTKDTLAYHCVQHQKTAWLAEAAREHPGDMLLWVDLGILHVPQVTRAHVARAVGLAERIPPDVVTLASIWGEPTKPIDPGVISWHCAGGVAACHASRAWTWHQSVIAEASGLLRISNRVSFEVNTWASVWLRHPTRFRSYRCDHDASILEVV